MKKKYDLRLDTHGNISPMNYGFFEHTHSLAYGSQTPINNDDLVEIETQKVIYRVYKSDMEKDAFRKFIEKAKDLHNK